MSGVATATNSLSSELPNSIKLLATRKTLWGMLDKRAVAVGGGGTHRLNLNDAILIKENHLTLSSDLKKDLRRVFKKAKKAKFIEIEVEDLNEVMDFILFQFSYYVMQFFNTPNSKNYFFLTGIFPILPKIFIFNPY